MKEASQKSSCFDSIYDIPEKARYADEELLAGCRVRRNCLQKGGIKEFSGGDRMFCILITEVVA